MEKTLANSFPSGVSFLSMAYLTYLEQIQAHVDHLREHGLQVESLQVNTTNWVRCREIGETRGRGEYAYKSDAQELANGTYGICTSFRGRAGNYCFKTYGLPPDGKEPEPIIRPINNQQVNEEHELAARKAYGFWNHFDTQGESSYLKRKGIGAHGIRFRTTERFGTSTVVPMRDIDGKVWGYQILNADGTKRMATNARTKGMMHWVDKPSQREPIGIAEGYCTAATVFEACGIPTACVFSADNLFDATKAISSFFSASPIFIFADNDRHIRNGNLGVLKAKESQNLDSSRISVVAPDFGDCEASKCVSDFNDLLRIFGADEVKRQISEAIS